MNEKEKSYFTKSFEKRKKFAKIEKRVHRNKISKQNFIENLKKVKKNRNVSDKTLK